ncbi:MAG: trypsin-like peptidase domain-containing protein [Verrucomicrobiota bacterium]|nr:trypsin-like peptidase domain-containing protein [Verrucomicrobiota bacterium]
MWPTKHLIHRFAHGFRQAFHPRLVPGAWIACAIMVLAGCATSPSGGSSQSVVPEPVVIDDRSIFLKMTSEASQMMDSDVMVDMDTLRAQLEKQPSIHLDLPEPTPLDPEDARKAITVVGGVYKCNRCTRWHVAPATGFLIAEDMVVTNYHVVDRPDHAGLVVRLFDGRVLGVQEVLAASESFDLALLRIPKTGIQPLTLGLPAPVGAKVDLISHPNQRFYTLSEGKVSRYFLRKHKDTPVPTMSITADFGRGSSGAPVLDPSGHVVGIAVSTESLYYNQKDGEQKNLQMVFKNCVPVAQLRRLIGG